MQDFHSGSPTHLATDAVCLILMVAAVLVGRSLSEERERLLRRSWVVGIVVVQVVHLVLIVRDYDPQHSLPLHLCDVAVVAAALAIWTRARVWRTLTYFWAIGFSSQAFLTPILEDGPAHVGFWVFWTTHLQVVGSAVYDVFVGGYRPNRRDFLVACAGTLFYGAVVFPIDMLFGLNYGFIGQSDAYGAGTMLDHLPGWPWRPFVIYALGVAGMAMLWLVWPLASLVSRRRRTGTRRS